MASPDYLPAELIDAIISISIADEPPITTFLSSLALVNRACRHQVNAHRFCELDQASIGFSNAAYARLRVLADLSASGVWPSYENIGQHFRGVYLRVSPIKEHTDAILGIMRVIFRADNQAKTSHMYTLCLHGGTSGNYAPIDDNFIAGLHDVCYNSHLRKLDMSFFKFIPATILLSRSITLASFEDVWFRRADTLDQHIDAFAEIFKKVKLPAVQELHLTPTSIPQFETAIWMLKDLIKPAPTDKPEVFNSLPRTLRIDKLKKLDISIDRYYGRNQLREVVNRLTPSLCEHAHVKVNMISSYIPDLSPGATRQHFRERIDHQSMVNMLKKFYALPEAQIAITIHIGIQLDDDGDFDTLGKEIMAGVQEEVLDLYGIYSRSFEVIVVPVYFDDWMFGVLD